MCIMQLKLFLLVVIGIGLCDLGSDILALLPSRMTVDGSDDFAIDDVHI